MLRRTVAATITALGEDEVEVIVSTDNLVRQDGLKLLPLGCVLDNYRRNPIWLWGHDPDEPIGRAEEIRVEPTQIVHRVRFAPPGISVQADKVRGLVKSGIVSGASIGFDFDPGDCEPIDPKQPRAGTVVKRWELFEASFVSVGADPDALVIARAQGGNMAEDWKVGAARNLPIEDSDDWDGPAAAKSIFDHAGGDDFDPAEARRGFLVYDADAPKLRGSYKLPIAHVVDGELKVPKGAIRAAASRLPQSDIPDEVKDSAGKVLDGYKKKAGIGDDDDGKHARRPRRRQRTASRAAPLGKLRGMYGVGQLAYLLDALGWAKKDAEIEAALEGDESKVPAILQAALQVAGEALVAMTVEEVAELVGKAETTDVTDEGLADGEIVVIQNCKTPAAKAFRTGFFAARAAVTASRAGKALSAANADRLVEAEGHHAKALDHHREATDCHTAIGEIHRGIEAAHGKAKAAHADLGDELAKDAPDFDRCQRAAKAIGRNLDAVDVHNISLGDEHEALGDAHRGIARSIRAADRCLRAVDGTEPDGDSQEIQNSGGTDDDEGARSADFRHRQADKLRLAAA